MEVLVTGSAGFIGYHLCKLLLQRKISVIGIDNISSYYDTKLKEERNKQLINNTLSDEGDFKFIKGDIANVDFINDIFNKFKPKYVVNLAAQAGVRYSIENPSAYVESNLVGFNNIIEACRNNPVKHLIFASSSSVYGGNKTMPFNEEHAVDHPVSLYAATKRSNELIAHTYSHLYNLPCTGLRFFTVYGPWGRPDMALFLFTKSIIEEKPINIFNNGNMVRDFTYIDDIAESISRVIFKMPSSNNNYNFKNSNPSESWSPFKLFNIGNSKPASLMDYIKAIETNLGITAKKNFLPMQAGDIESTESDNTKLQNWIDFRPNTSIEKGVGIFIKWYREFYKV